MRVRPAGQPDGRGGAVWPLRPGTEELWLELQVAVMESEGGRPPCTEEPERWWPEGSVSSAVVDEAVAGCGRCAAVDACLAYAVAAGERHGVWGGLRPAERRGHGEAVAS